MKITDLLFESNKKTKDKKDWDEGDWAEWDDMMDRLEKKAKSGEQEVYYNPETRRYGVRTKKKVTETATAGATSSANVGTVVNPHHSPGKARGKKSYIGDPWGGKSGTKAPPQPKVVQPKNSDGTAKNGADMPNLFGAGTIKRR